MTLWAWYLFTVYCYRQSNILKLLVKLNVDSIGPSVLLKFSNIIDSFPLCNGPTPETSSGPGPKARPGPDPETSPGTKTMFALF